MNCEEKLKKIVLVIKKVNKKCPECNSELETELGEYNCPVCLEPVYEMDYFNKIKSIIDME